MALANSVQWSPHSFHGMGVASTAFRNLPENQPHAPSIPKTLCNQRSLRLFHVASPQMLQDAHCPVFYDLKPFSTGKSIRNENWIQQCIVDSR